MSRTAPLAPTVADADVYLIECDMVVAGRRERYFVERDSARTNRADTLKDITDRQYENLRRVLCLNPFEGWCHDVSEDIARDVLAHEINDTGVVCRCLFDFCEEHLGCATVATAEREAA